ncbi:EamA family transporter RarD [Pseudoalteromonas denitrificans]|uniref:Chloramphenicol-sensitive protein RarD n=1 Tax=Pseudoalteromonas denitrificans DSM 6059 TaxID=1123010 RepID=A0A1I1J4S0_9GAMM|nr:EamA family transporter RarD [Pseudoalteromonas denitrificans]SFC43375.1 chloramphenicol-sensitive protein RarD [Pseudoalteromonas denitrificans DSM 6059]
MTNEQQKQGIYYALAAFIMWGLAPIYFKLIDSIDALEILAHRVVWSFVFILIIIAIKKNWQKVRVILKKPKLMLMLLLTSTLLGFNWGLFIWAVNSGHMLDTSLGYYINPLFNVLLGIFFLGERLRLFQGIAVGLAVAGVLIQVINFGSVPIISLGLATSFAIYGLLRKKMAVESLPGLLLESLILVPLALIYWFFYVDSSSANLMNNNWQLNLLLVSAGIVTTLPLLCFTAAAKRLQYSTLGFFQYIGPSLMFVLAVVFYGESVGVERLFTFGFIWAALALYTWDAIRSNKAVKG